MINHIVATVDGDFLRFQRLRNFPDQTDIQQPVYELRARYFNVIRKVEFALEAAVGNSLIQVIAVVFNTGFFTANSEDSFLDLDVQLAFFEARDRQRNSVMVLAGRFDIVRGIAGSDLVAAKC